MTKDTRSRRVRAALAAVAVQALLAYALLVGLRVGVPAADVPAMTLVTLTPPAPPRQRPGTRPARRVRPAASRPNLRADPVEVAVPRPVVEAMALPPIAAAPVAAAGDDVTAGASDRAGPGTGDGDGGDGDWTPSVWVRGRIDDADYPRGAAGSGGSLTTRYTVGTNGRVTDCSVTRSSGSRDLDDATCRLIVARFRFRPARDGQGRAIRDIVTEDHRWTVVDTPP